MEDKRKKKQTQRASAITDFLKNKRPLSKHRKYVFYKFITDLKYVQNFPGDIMPL